MGLWEWHNHILRLIPFIYIFHSHLLGPNSHPPKDDDLLSHLAKFYSIQSLYSHNVQLLLDQYLPHYYLRVSDILINLSLDELLIIASFSSYLFKCRHLELIRKFSFHRNYLLSFLSVHQFLCSYNNLESFLS